MDDIRNLTDEELLEARQEIADERDRRETLLSLPAAVADLAKQYAAAGGEQEDLVQAIRDPDAVTPEPVEEEVEADGTQPQE